MANPITTYLNQWGRYPANNQVWFVSKNQLGEFQPKLMDDIHFGSSRAAQGYYILETFNKNRQGIVGGLTAENSDTPALTRPTTNAFFSGRYWCAGATDEDLSGRIYYSQILEDIKDANKCYSENDPTAENFNEVLDTDGGVILIPEIGQIYNLTAMSSGVAVLANNGVWLIQGADGNQFTPNSISIQQITTFGCTSPRSVISLGTSLIYWNADGIYTVGFDLTQGAQFQDLTAQSIATLYEAIPSVCKQNAQGVLNNKDKKVHWMYSSTEPTGLTNRYQFDRVLTYDLQLQAFFTYSIGELSQNSPFVSAIFETSSQASSTLTSRVAVGADTLILTNLDEVVITQDLATSSELSLKMLTFNPNLDSTYGMTFSEFRREDFVDWFSNDGVGVDAPAFAIPAWFTGGEPSREKKATYVTTHFNRTETGFDTGLNPTNPSSCFMQAQWSWADSDAGNLKGAEQQVYRYQRIYVPVSTNDAYDYGQSILTTRTKIRGNGHSLTLKFRSEPLKDFQLLGWTINTSTRV